MTVERTMKASPDVLFRAWTQDFDRWFADPGSLLIKAEVNAVFFFEAVHEGVRRPHYGRFLRIEPDRLLELTWVNEETQGETVLRVELTPAANGTLLRLTHSGFPNDEVRAAHSEAWPVILKHLDETTASWA